MVCTREHFGAEMASLHRNQNKGECLRVCMSKCVRTVEATSVKSEVEHTKSSGEREVGDTKNSVVKTEVSNTENFAIESEYEST